VKVQTGYSEPMLAAEHERLFGFTRIHPKFAVLLAGLSMSMSRYGNAWTDPKPQSGQWFGAHLGQGQ
jgi:hypothetical protein